MENRFTDFFRLAPDDPSLARVFGDSLGREPTESEHTDLQQFWKNDVRRFARWLEDSKNQYTLYRSTIYDEYIRPKTPPEFLESVRAEARGTAAEMEERRQRFRIPFKLMTDLAYNANAPATLNIKSFVPPDMPDPVSLPLHLFRAVQFPNPAMDRHGEAVRQAYADLLARRVEAGEQFFYASQTFEQLPGIGSFTLRDASTVMEWPEWRSFRLAQQAALRFERAEELETLMRDYWTTVKEFHDRLEIEAKHRQRWRQVGSGAVRLSIAVTAHVMGHVLLPDLMHSTPWWATVTAATAVAQPIHAGLDIIVHGVEAGSNFLRTELGFKDGGMREFTISPEMQAKLEELKTMEVRLSEARRADDAIIANASNRIASGASRGYN